MSQNIQLDPVAKDYVFVNGSPVPSDRVQEKAYYALSIPQGNWLYGAQGQGSLLYTLQQMKRNNSIEQIFANYGTDAIQRQLVDTGDASDVQIGNIATSPTGTSNQIEVIPSTSQLSNQLNFEPLE